MAVTVPSLLRTRQPERHGRSQRARASGGTPCVLIGTDTYPPDVNGAAYFTARLAQGLIARGVNVHVLCQSDEGPPGVEVRDGVTVHRLRSMPSLVHATLRLTVPAGTRGHVEQLLRRLRPDVIHIQNHFIVGRLLLSAARRHAIPVVATNHFMPENLFNYLHVPEALRTAIGDLAWRDFCRVLRDVEHITTPTRIAAQLLLDKGFQRPVEAISCGIDLSRFHPSRDAGTTEGGADEARSRVRARLGMADRPTVVFVGRLDEEKHIEDLIEALPQVLVADTQLVLAGTGSQRQRMERLAAEKGVADRVHFLGFVSHEELPLVYRAADVYAISGTAELQSIATLEAMASGLPVVAADAMALPHLVEIGRNGYLYQPGDTGELAKYLTTILSSPEERIRMGEASRAMAAPHDQANSLARYERVYRDVSHSHTH
ncbi:glycosyltransferase [Salinactinospora qingdaonensis]|uniref:Uncharacterized protein n=1 Tax=Salinactinospora qingdaonensis TaxID=702744 RepID=A0ABP7G078_9ACTN